MARRDRRGGGAQGSSGEPSPDRSGEEGATDRGDGSGPATGEAAGITTGDAGGTTTGVAGESGSPVPTAAGAAATGGAAADLGVPFSRAERRRAGKAGRKDPDGRRRRKSKHPWLDRALLAGVIVVTLALVAVVSGYFYVEYRFNQVAKVTVKHLRKAPVGQPFNVLLIGSDSRAGLTPAQQTHLGNQSNAGGQRSDVVKIVHVVPATGQVSVLSIPRDTVVTVAGDISQTGQYNRINATYASGPDQLVQTIEANFGIPIEHVVQIDFDGLEGAVDAIGGINVNFPYPAKDAYTGLNVTQPGCQTLNGGYGLALARSRHYEYFANGYWHYDGTSDFGRIQRQNAFLKAMINQAESKYNPLTLNAFIGSVVQGVTIDSTFAVSDLVTLAREFHNFSSQSLATATLPTYSQYSSAFSALGDVLYVQQPQADQVITQFLGGPADPVTTPPPDPYGEPESSTTTTTLTGTTAGSTPATSAASETTTSIETDFDPTPC
jgi:LCP family protein required for cell wall assembly